VSVFPISDTDTDTTLFGVGKSDTDTDTKVLRCRRYFLILNPTLFAFFLQKAKKNCFGVRKTETPTTTFFDVDILTPTPTLTPDILVSVAR
jgi:hypothetical protein